MPFSSSLNRKVIAAVAVIILVVLSYLLLFLLVTLFSAFLCYLGILALSAGINIITIPAGLLMNSIGLLVFYFLLRYSFRINKADHSGRKEIFAEDEPLLFENIRILSRQMNVRFPKKIYLLPDVEASVSYYSTFWSMFFPVGKNLYIGLGLVNTLSSDELKAILAHEFGHFSQKSTLVGTYVYQVNQILYNLLYHNNYIDILQSWSRKNVAFLSLIAEASGSLINGVQSMLRKLYHVLNISHLSLSREMEFHADAMSASVVDASAMIRALYKLDYSFTMYNGLLNFYDEKIVENIRTDNIYLQHRWVMCTYASIYKLRLENGLPVITGAEIDRFHKNRVSIKDQWASHPTIKDRVARLEPMRKNNEISRESAWDWFKDPKQSQLAVTDMLFERVTYQSVPENISFEDFKQKYTEKINRYRLDDRYNGYYDSRVISKFNLEEINTTTQDPISFEDLFSDDRIDLNLRKQALEEDVNVLMNIEAGNIKVNHFELDNKKYRTREAEIVLEELKKEENSLKRQLEENDMQAFLWFYGKARTIEEKDHLKKLYDTHFMMQDSIQENRDLYKKISERSVFIHYETPINKIEIGMGLLKKEESVMKEKLSGLLSIPDMEQCITSEMKEKLEEYLSQDWAYFNSPNYDNEALNRLFTGMNSFAVLSEEALFLTRKKIADYQLSLLKSGIE